MEDEKHKDLRTGGQYSLIDPALTNREGTNVYVAFQGFKSFDDAETWRFANRPGARTILDPYPYKEEAP